MRCGQNCSAGISLSADKKISYGFLIQVLDALKQAGVKGNLNALTEPK